MGHFDVILARILYPHATIVLDHLIFAADTAKDRGATGRILNRVLWTLDRAALRAADVIVVDTPAHRAMVPNTLRAKTAVVLVGAPQAWFDARPSAQPSSADDSRSPLSVMFFGLFTPLQGTPVIASGLRDAAAERPIRITMVGTGQDYDECRRILSDTDVTWVDWVDADDLPGLIASHDVCVGILGTTSKAQHVIPNKVYQGMAAGCCVITSDTPAQRKILGDAAMWCPPGDSQALTDRLVSLSDDRDLLGDMKQRAARLADRSFSSDKVTRALAEALR
jgi:glycosyltransferase involved in cell wall biosynthesis